MYEIKLIRIYEYNHDIKGYPILVDKLWPRGIKKDSLEPFVWAKNIAPSNELRKWFGHESSRFVEFKNKYHQELNENEYTDEFIDLIKKKLQNQPVIFLFAAKNKEENQAVVLSEWIKEVLANDNTRDD